MSQRANQSRTAPRSDPPAGRSGGKDELWQLFQQETSVENKKAILQSLFLTGDSAKLAELARSLKEPELKVAAIKSLGLMGGNGHGDVLVSIYQSDHDPEVRSAVLNALFLQQNGKALVDLARAEKRSAHERRNCEEDGVGSFERNHRLHDGDFKVKTLLFSSPPRL